MREISDNEYYRVGDRIKMSKSKTFKQVRKLERLLDLQEVDFKYPENISPDEYFEIISELKKKIWKAGSHGNEYFEVFIENEDDWPKEETIIKWMVHHSISYLDRIPKVKRNLFIDIILYFVDAVEDDAFSYYEDVKSVERNLRVLSYVDFIPFLNFVEECISSIPDKDIKKLREYFEDAYDPFLVIVRFFIENSDECKNRIDQLEKYNWINSRHCFPNFLNLLSFYYEVPPEMSINSRLNVLGLKPGNLDYPNKVSPRSTSWDSDEFDLPF